VSRRRKAVVRATHNLEKNLQRIEVFLESVGASHRYDDLVDDLLQRVIPLLEITPKLGTPFDSKQLPAEAQLVAERIRSKLDGGTFHQLVRGDFLALYLIRDDKVHLLAVRHHREASFQLG
jgi:hypothetical protein